MGTDQPIRPSHAFHGAGLIKDHRPGIPASALFPLPPGRLAEIGAEARSLWRDTYSRVLAAHHSTERGLNIENYRKLAEQEANAAANAYRARFTGQ